MRRTLLLMLAACFYGMRISFGSDIESTTTWLAQSLVAPEQPQAEIEGYLAARIPRMPQITSRQEWDRQAESIRKEMLAKVIYRGKGAEWRDAQLGIDWQEVLHGDEGYRIKKLRYEALPGLWIPALLYEPLHFTGPTAVALNINGHDANGKGADYKQIRCINQAKRGMLSLNVEWLGMGQLRGTGYGHGRMNQLDLCGTCGMAPFYLAMKRGLDVLLSHPHADPKRVAVAGLSGGGWQTIFISALDTRVTLANPVAGYSSFLTRIRHHSDLGDSEQTPNDMATVGDYTHLTALLAPRATLLTYNIKDNCCFASDHALPPLLDAATPIFKLYGQESRLRSHVNHDPGTHNFERDNREALYRTLIDESFMGQPGMAATEMDSQAEVKSAEQLRVSLPEPNADFNTLAKQLAQSLPRDAVLPTNRADAEAWQPGRRQRLQERISYRDYSVQAEKVSEEVKSGITATGFRLHLGENWTVPAIELTPSQPKGTTLLCGEAGRSKLAATVEELLESGQRVVAVDPFYVGESQIRTRGYLWSLLVQTVGDRPAGLQASQLTAIARWLHTRYAESPLHLEAHGPRLALSALCAAALESEAIHSVKLHQSLASLHEVIESNTSFEQQPELFCFGLLEQFDIVTIAALVAPRDVRFTGGTDRHKQELSPLTAWYQLWDKKVDPLQSK